VAALARAAHLSSAHFSREFRRAFGETPRQYLLTRRMERAAALLRNTDRSVADICLTVGLRSVGSFTTTFGRSFGLSPTAYRASHPPAADRARIPTLRPPRVGAPAVQQVSRRQPRIARLASSSIDPTTRRMTMLKQLTRVNVWVHDQDEALAFYTEKLGPELRDDVTLPDLGNFRWLTVGPPKQRDVALALMAVPGPPVFSPDTRDQLQAVMAKGAAGGLFFATDDCRASCAQLKSRGVEFTEEPSERPYGIDAAFRDPSGNQIRIVQAT
jgi:AraC-like DNA-binding protein/catechol 2,3-dioxygenase-like lactoylglutathione lyase family enzyme